MIGTIVSSLVCVLSTIAPISNSQEQVTSHIEAYIAARDAFNQSGGEEFLADRRVVRDAYCQAAVLNKSLAMWVQNLPNKRVQREFHRRFMEWNGKIAKGILTKSESPALTEGQFFETLQAFYDHYKDFLEGPVFKDFAKAKRALRKDLLPQLMSSTVEELAKQYNITDPELIDRMQFEWLWKVQ